MFAGSGPLSKSARLHRKALRLEWLTLLWNILEAVIAIASGAVAGSTALVAFGVDSLIEVSSALVVVWRLLKAGPEASIKESAFLDKRAHFLVGITFYLLAGWVTVNGLLTLFRREIAEESPVGIVLATASLIVMPLLSYSKQRTGREMQSKALQADAVETWLCSYLSGSLLLGLVLNAQFGWWWSDPVAALAMVPFMIWQGLDAVHEALSEDMNG
jgi:divalent metal cation (Fe/Co/Zn/Cd) transporter